MSAFSKVFTCFFSQHGRLLCDIVLANHRCGRLSEPQHRTHRAIFFHRGLRVNKYVYDICIKFVYFFCSIVYIYILIYPNDRMINGMINGMMRYDEL